MLKTLPRKTASSKTFQAAAGCCPTQPCLQRFHFQSPRKHQSLPKLDPIQLSWLLSVRRQHTQLTSQKATAALFRRLQTRLLHWKTASSIQQSRKKIKTFLNSIMSSRKNRKKTRLEAHVSPLLKRWECLEGATAAFSTEKFKDSNDMQFYTLLPCYADFRKLLKHLKPGSVRAYQRQQRGIEKRTRQAFCSSHREPAVFSSSDLSALAFSQRPRSPV